MAKESLSQSFKCVEPGFALLVLSDRSCGFIFSRIQAGASASRADELAPVDYRQACVHRDEIVESACVNGTLSDARVRAARNKLHVNRFAHRVRRAFFGVCRRAGAPGCVHRARSQISPAIPSETRLSLMSRPINRYRLIAECWC